MIDDLKPYAEYKESGLPWLGKVPGHWEVRRMKSAVMNVIEQTLEMSSDEVYVALEHVESWTGKARPQLGSNLFTGQVKRFRQGDVLFGKLRPYLAKVTRISNDGVCAGEFFVLRPTDEAVSSAYLEHQLRAKHTIDVINGSTFGAKMPRADWQFCGNLPITLPPPAEQAAIVRFLDWATGRLERAIRVKRKVIALLNEQKQVIIHRAVTRGLDSSVALKPSGIPWLGDIPQHWEVRRLGRLAKVFNGTTPSRAQPAYWSNGTIPWLASGKVNDRMINTPSELITARALADCSLTIVPSGALLMGLIGQGRTRGMCALLTIDACISQNLAAVVPGPVLSNEFLYYVLLACYHDVREFGRGGNQAALNCEIVGRLPVPVPPQEEQVAISRALKAEVSHLLPLECSIESEIDLLREYRTRLVADVVTGKLDVRGAAARLPDEAPLDTAEDDTDPSLDAELADETAEA